jgi:predicted dithiol-disulfide oxidoreductase (DUF899 family)
MTTTFPGESPQYRAARDRLLRDEIDLRRAMETVAAARRALPPGGIVPEDYVFQGAGPDGAPTDVRLSELFASGRDSLIVYSFMFPRDPGDDRPGPADGESSQWPLCEGPCPSCVALLDQLDGAVAHVAPRANLVIAAKAPLPRLLTFAQERGWRQLRLVSSAGNTYTATTSPRPPRDRRGRCSTSSVATAARSATSGARSSSTRRPSQARIPAMWARSSRTGTSSTSRPRGATSTSTSS